MNNRDRLSDLEDILAEVQHQSAEEIASDLKKAGIDTDRFLARANNAMQTQYRSHLRKLADAERDREVVTPAFFAHLPTMDREEMLLSFASLRDGTMGINYKEAALARCREKDATQLSDEELRSWLNDIAEINGAADGDA
jgi:hypothetical protein